jgi:excisionase family DNA binding protein
MEPIAGEAKTDERLLTPGEVAHTFRVDPKTVIRWAKTGKLNSIRTPGGQRRYRESEVLALLEARQPAAEMVRGANSRPCEDTHLAEHAAVAS